MTDVESSISLITRISFSISEALIPLAYNGITSFSIKIHYIHVWALLSAQTGHYGHGD